jgi:hypothetical protein
MQASAANGFMATIMGNCKGVPFNYEPEYDTASPNNVVPWAALLGGILTQYEIGHFTPCTTLSNPATDGLLNITAGDPFSLTCNGPYETVSDSGTNRSRSVVMRSATGRRHAHRSQPVRHHRRPEPDHRLPGPPRRR